jgi:hypothetical protein
MAHLIVGQTGFALAPLEACFDARFGFGHPGTFSQRRLRGSIGQIKIHFDHLLVVSVAVAYHHQPFLVALLTSMGTRHHASLDRVDHQGPCAPIADIDAPPGVIRQHAIGLPQVLAHLAESFLT